MSSEETATNSVCYRHPDRQTQLACNRCGRAICTECARSSEVGYKCPECIYELHRRRFPSGFYFDPLWAPQNKPLITYVLLVILVMFWGLQEVLGGSTDSETLIQVGSTYGERILQGEIWRLFSAMFLHIGLAHLLFNTFALFNLGRDVESRYGPGRFILIYLASGYFGNLVSFMLRGPFEFSAGASGAIFGLLGAELGFLLFHRRQLGQFGREQQRQIVRVLLINLVIGLLVLQINTAAHVGGFLAGLSLGYLTAPRYLPVLDQQGNNKYQDQAGLQRRWWVPALTVALLAAGTWGAIQAWRHYGEVLEVYAVQIQFLPFSLLTGVWSGWNSEPVQEEVTEPDAIWIDAKTQCFPEPSAAITYCTGQIEAIEGEYTQTIHLAKLGNTSRYHATLGVYADTNLHVEVKDVSGQVTKLQTFSELPGGASSYIGIVSTQFEIVFDAVDGSATNVTYTIYLTAAD